jgi:CBS domain-containing protein
MVGENLRGLSVIWGRVRPSIPLSKSSDRLSAKVKDFMEAPPVVVNEDATIDQAAATMWDRRIGSVIVVDKEGKMAGILTASDIIFAVTKSLIGRQVPVSGIMSKTSIMATPNESVLTAVERMMKENVRHLPVIEKNGTPVGIISTRDTMSITEPLLKFVFRPKRKAAAKKPAAKRAKA